MKRLFWLALGVTVGALGLRWLSRTADRLRPTALAREASAGLGSLTESVREFAADVRDAMGQREAQLREASGLDTASGRHALPAMAEPVPTDPARRSVR